MMFFERLVTDSVVFISFKIEVFVADLPINISVEIDELNGVVINSNNIFKYKIEEKLKEFIYSIVR